ncbi:MAG TPA: DUF4340 domain-containing protein [Candidatus Binataceae bacterium]|nr:DUF4340 domain-containing protein [Candidatus Binataceae bacterium]
MSLRNTIIVLILLIVVGGYALIIGLGSKPIPPPTLLKFKDKDVTAIELKYPDREVLLRRGADGGWQIEKPIEAKADRATVKTLINAIANCQLKETLEQKPADLAPFGLKNPRALVTVTIKGKGALPPIELGNKTPVGYSAYARVGDKPAVVLVAESFSADMMKTANDFRDRSLMNFKVDQVEQFAIDHHDGAELELSRTGDKWQILKPAPYQADPTIVLSALSALADLRVADFIVDNPTNLAEYGLDQPRFTITVYTGKHGESQELKFGKDEIGGKDGIYVQRAGNPAIFTIYKESLNAFDKSLNEFRDKTVLSFEPSKVGRVDVENAMERYTITRVAKGWTITWNGKTEPAKTAVVENFLDQIRFLKGTSIVADPMVDEAKFGMDQPRVLIRVFDRKGQQIGQLKLSTTLVASRGPNGGPKGNQEFPYAASSASRAVYAIDSYDYSQINKTVFDFGFDHGKPHSAATSTPSK